LSIGGDGVSLSTMFGSEINASEKLWSLYQTCKVISIYEQSIYERTCVLTSIASSSTFNRLSNLWASVGPRRTFDSLELVLDQAMSRAKY